MKKNRITLIIVLVLSIVAGYLWFNNKTGTIKKELKDFAVKDTANVSKIFMADGIGRTVTLERKTNSIWTVNGNAEARKDGIDLLLNTISQLEVKSPVSRASLDHVVSNMAGNSTKIEIYMGKDKPAKVYYVGGATPDNMGTFMLLENSSVPFVMFIPGHRGYLSSRYFIDETEWKSTALYRYNPNEIEKIEINYVKSPEESFAIENISTRKPRLKSIQDNKYLEKIDTLSIIQFVSNFRHINFEFYANDTPLTTKDSIMDFCKNFSIEITDIHGKVNSFTGYNKPMKEGSTDLEGNPITFDMDRMYGLTNEKDFVIIQFFVFNELTPRINYFLNQDTVKRL
ncbi:MAG: DUF4340 domain-containing protein [Bacteroidetes bacterium]|nr:DUF4340 domain-containing protein [Bacteroidota bacterium]HET6243047.1 DUF4340 domain-containing protein [Bacteroidia bacterium]